MKIVLSLSIVSSMLLIGCAGATITPLKDYQYKPKAEDCAVEIYNDPPKDKKYEELAVVTAKGGQTIFEGSDLATMLPDMKKKVCAMGGDALILKSVNEGGAKFFGPKDAGQASGVIIKFL